MTLGWWTCMKCGHFMTVDIEEFVEKCPKCETEYQLIKTLKPHPFHTVPVFRLKETGEIGTNEPLAFLTGGSQKDVEKYLRKPKSRSNWNRFQF